MRNFLLFIFFFFLLQNYDAIKMPLFTNALVRLFEFATPPPPHHRAFTEGRGLFSFLLGVGRGEGRQPSFCVSSQNTEG